MQMFWQTLAAFGIPTTITGIGVWFFQRSIKKRDKKREKEQEERDRKAEERERNTEKLMLMIMQTSRATNVLAEATAKAVQRIPDAHCNGDMTAALKRAEEIQKEEQQFLIDQGVKHIFGD